MIIVYYTNRTRFTGRSNNEHMNFLNCELWTVSYFWSAYIYILGNLGWENQQNGKTLNYRTLQITKWGQSKIKRTASTPNVSLHELKIESTGRHDQQQNYWTVKQRKLKDTYLYDVLEDFNMWTRWACDNPTKSIFCMISKFL